MAIYAIGDVQGCLDDLLRLLDKIRFDPTADRLWLAGDMVNRGPKSLETLRFIKRLGNRATCVLGNHDLHLLAVATTRVKHRRKDTFADVLKAPDREEILDWLRHCPLLNYDPVIGYTVIHAGLPPQWSLDTASRCASEVELVLRSADYTSFLENMYGDLPDRWDDALDGWERLRFITNCLTRLRYCGPDGRLALKAKGRPGTQTAGIRPWFTIPGRASRDMKVVFGHWSTLGFHVAPGIFALDTGCQWGGRLTALRLDGKPQPSSVACRRAKRLYSEIRSKRKKLKG